MASERTHSVLSPIFKQLLAAIEKDGMNLKECALQLQQLAASFEQKVGKLQEEEVGVLAMPTSKRKHSYK